MKLTVVMDSPADATLDALAHATAGVEAEVVVIRTRDLSGDPSQLCDGVVVGPGSPYDHEGAVIEAIRTAREKGIPLVGT